MQEANATTVSTGGDDATGESGGLTPIHYIIIVLMFYMGGLTILIIKYVQSENEEARYQQYYEEFVKRPQFNRPQLMKQIKESNSELPQNGSVTRLNEKVSFFHLPEPENEGFLAERALESECDCSQTAVTSRNNNNNDATIHATDDTLTIVVNGDDSRNGGVEE